MEVHLPTKKTTARSDWLMASQQLRGVAARKKYFHSTFLAEYYHENSKMHPDLMSIQKPNIQYTKPNYYRYEGVLPKLDLTPRSALPKLEAKLEDVLQNRRSSWRFAEEGCTIRELELLLQYAGGVTKHEKIQSPEGEFELRKRAYPSGGALYPIQMYVHAENVVGLPNGLYKYSSFHSCLYQWQNEAMQPGKPTLAELTYGTDPDHNPLDPYENYAQASFFIFLTADVQHVFDKYGARGYRLALLEAGHLAQNLFLVGEALSLSSVPLAGFYDERVHQFLEIEGMHEMALYMLPFGKRPQLKEGGG